MYFPVSCWAFSMYLKPLSSFQAIFLLFQHNMVMRYSRTLEYWIILSTGLNFFLLQELCNNLPPRHDYTSPAKPKHQKKTVVYSNSPRIPSILVHNYIFMRNKLCQESSPILFSHSALLWLPFAGDCWHKVWLLSSIQQNTRIPKYVRQTFPKSCVPFVEGYYSNVVLKHFCEKEKFRKFFRKNKIMEKDRILSGGLGGRIYFGRGL